LIRLASKWGGVPALWGKCDPSVEGTRQVYRAY
jgi:hypothetical protein